VLAAGSKNYRLIRVDWAVFARLGLRNITDCLEFKARYQGKYNSTVVDMIRLYNKKSLLAQARNQVIIEM
jgi:hypothetical protein